MSNEDVLRPRVTKQIKRPRCGGTGKQTKVYPVSRKSNPLQTDRVPVKEICVTCKGHGFVRV